MSKHGSTLLEPDRSTKSRDFEEGPEPQELGASEDPRSLRLSRKSLLTLLAQLSVMLDSGTQVPAALQAMRQQCEDHRTEDVLEYLEGVVRSGRTLSFALETLPNAVPVLVARMVAAGERAGCMGEMIQRVTEMLEDDDDLRGRLRSALLYPVVMLTVATAVVVFLLTVIVPRFTTLFRGKEEKLPAPTKVLMYLGDFFSSNAIWLLPTVGVLLVALVVFLRSRTGRPYLDWALLRIPVLQDIYRTAILSRTSRTLGMLTQSGVAILPALEHTRDVAGSPAFEELWSRLHDEVANGGTIGEAIRPSPLLPATYKQMVGAGEATARLDVVLLQIADHYASQLKRKVRDFTTLLEPLLVVVMGGVVGFIALSIMLPIFKLSRGG